MIIVRARRGEVKREYAHNRPFALEIAGDLKRYDHKLWIAEKGKRRLLTIEV